ncbi:major histocompatibility complex class I-related gene protein-like [Gastrophryne carolinensis]
MAARSLFLVLALVTRARAEGHQLAFHFTTTWEGDSSLAADHQVVTSLDDVVILIYSHGTLQCLYPWMERIEKAHWSFMNSTAQYYERRHRETIQRLKRTGHSQKYVYQVRFVCEIFKDNTTSGVEEFAAQGKDFIFLDNMKQKFMASVNDDITATELVEEWNRRVGSVKRQFYYKDTKCIQWLRLYLDHKEDHLLQNVPPEVKVWGRQSGEVTTLHCLVYGFHPRDIDVKWMKNQTVRISTNEDAPILPHPDGTYQTRASMEVPTWESYSYSCHVDHSSLDEPLIVKYEKLHKGGRNPVVRWLIVLITIIPPPILILLIGTDLQKMPKWCIGLAAFLYIVAVTAVMISITILGRKNKAFTEPD